MIKALPSGESGWQAELRLEFTQRSNKTVLAKRHQRGPLAIQRPFYPEAGVCHAYVLHPPGGVVGGDALHLHFKVEPHAHALLTTPGASKFYRSAGLQAAQHQQFHVNDACLEWLPQETIFFPNAQAVLTSTIHLQGSAQYIGWEVYCLGRPVIGETFQPGKVVFKTALYRDAKPLLLDRLVVNGERDLFSAAGLRGQPVFATLLATPVSPELLETVQPFCEGVALGTAGVTLLNGVLIVRYLGNSTAQAHRLFRTIWQAIRPAVNGHVATAPRIWNT
ncbi:urease accessory protein UreD [Thiolinea disciformis]|uniref:urease accessory protein UreD n=1 Tax=Thiolinea disciformis TaxID=125614 RepID=UPI00036B2191|nr:urease accessory protein UreD [Thiolinea disciformis]